MLFSLEEILGDLHAPVFGTVVLSSATSWMVLHLVLGDEPLFHVALIIWSIQWSSSSTPCWAWWEALAQSCFVKLLLTAGAVSRASAPPCGSNRRSGGLAVGIMGWFVPEVLGVGYDYVERSSTATWCCRPCDLLAVLKIVATAVCYASGNAGGIFGPSLFIGAMMGGAVGSVAHLFSRSTPPSPAPTRWWAWARPSPASCARR